MVGVPLQFSSVQSLIRVWLFATPWTTACQASLSITNSPSLPKLMFIESVMPSSHLILCHPLLLLPSIFPNNRFFSNELALCIRRPKYWSFSFSISPSKEYSGLISFMLSHFSHVRLFATPSDCSPPGSSIYGILQARILEWVAISFSKGSSQPRDRTHISFVSCIGRRVLYH